MRKIDMPYCKRAHLAHSTNSEVQELYGEHNHIPVNTATFKSAKNYFLLPSMGALAFVEAFNCRVIAGEPVVYQSSPQAMRESQELVLRRFIENSHKRGQAVTGYYFSEDCRVDQLEFPQVGTSTILDLERFSISGKESTEVRRALNHGERVNLAFFEVPQREKDKWNPLLQSLYTPWFKTKRGPEIQFLLSRPQTSFLHSERERWYLVMDDLGVAAFLSVLPYQTGGMKAYYIDHMIQFPNRDKLALDFLIAKMMLQLQTEKVRELSFGFNAFSILNPQNWIEWSLWLHKKFPILYASEGLRKYKAKFGGVEVPRYLAIDPQFSKRQQVTALFLATYQKRSHYDQSPELSVF